MKIRGILALVLMVIGAPAMADVAADMTSGLNMRQVLVNGVNEGLLIDEAVCQAVTVDPSKAGDAVTAALLLLPTLPPDTCVGSPLWEDNEFTVNRPACWTSVMQQAIECGGDPDVVQDAASAVNYGTISTGSPGSPPGPQVSPF